MVIDKYWLKVPGMRSWYKSIHLSSKIHFLPFHWSLIYSSLGVRQGLVTWVLSCASLGVSYTGLWFTAVRHSHITCQCLIVWRNTPSQIWLQLYNTGHFCHCLCSSHHTLVPQIHMHLMFWLAQWALTSFLLLHHWHKCSIPV